MADVDKLWSALNERQKTYLQTIFEIDQEQEAWERGAWNRGERSRPASEWRWIRYDSLLGDPPLRSRLKMAGLVDPGTGSTFQALEARKLIEMRWTGPMSERHLDVKLTTLGRKLARHSLGIATPQRVPVGTLSEWLWQALVELYEAGEAGLAWRPGGYGSVSWATCLRLINYGSSSHHAGSGPMSLLREERMADGSTRAVITTYGRLFYAEHHADYVARYPDVAAPAPRGDAPTPAPRPKIAPAPPIPGLVGPGVPLRAPFIHDVETLMDVGTVVWVIDRTPAGQRVAKPSAVPEQERWGAWRAAHPALRVGIVRGVVAWWDPLERQIMTLAPTMLACVSDGKREVFDVIGTGYNLDDALVPGWLMKPWESAGRTPFRLPDLCWEHGGRRELRRELTKRMLAGVTAAERSAATKAGMERARERGVHMGRPVGSAAPTAVVLSRYPEIVEALRAGDGIRATARDLGVAVNTVRKVALAMRQSEES